MKIINPYVPYIKNYVLEAKANELIERYGQDSIIKPPVPVEKIAELLLDLNIDWASIDDDDDDKVLGFLDPEQSTITINDIRKDQLENNDFTIAHEIGHYVLHLIDSGQITLDLDFPETSLRRISNDKSSYQRKRREVQADKFASYLLMPSNLIDIAVKETNIYEWPNLYELARRFRVSTGALVIRLEELGLLYIEEKRIYRSKEDCNGQMKLM